MKLKHIIATAALLLPLPALAQEVAITDIFGLSNPTIQAQPNDDGLYPHRHSSRNHRRYLSDVGGSFLNATESGYIQQAVTQAALVHGVPPALAHAVVRIESGYNCHARHGGLMQVLGGTARSMGITGSLQLCHNSLEAGMRYLHLAYERSGGNWCLAATSYNTGSMGTRQCSAYGRRVLARVARYD